jgi:hypothetical protein
MVLPIGVIALGIGIVVLFFYLLWRAGNRRSSD